MCVEVLHAHGQTHCNRNLWTFLCLLPLVSCAECMVETEVDGYVSLLQLSMSVKSAATPENGQASTIKKEWDGLDIEAKRSLWWELTQDMQDSNAWPILGDKPVWPPGPGERALLDEWNKRIGIMFEKKSNEKKLRCSETGDGHFLKDAFGKVCQTILSVDLFDPNADVQMDLNLPPAQAPEHVKHAMHTMDIVVSHQVLEHLKHPTVGIANLNALLKVGGYLVLTTPFTAPDHKGPGDDFLRWTVRGLRNLAECAGFKMLEVRGLGDRFEEIAYLAGVSNDMMDASHLGVGCDGLASNDCSEQYFAAAAVLGLKTEHKTIGDIRQCFG